MELKGGLVVLGSGFAPVPGFRGHILSDIENPCQQHDSTSNVLYKDIARVTSL